MSLMPSDVIPIAQQDFLEHDWIFKKVLPAVWGRRLARISFQALDLCGNAILQSLKNLYRSFGFRTHKF